MDRLPIWVGLDYHTCWIQVCVMNEKGEVLLNRRCDNWWASVADMANAMGDVRGVAIEACCGSASLADQLRNLAAWPVQMAHPGYVNRMRRGPDKSDWSDGKLLADLVRVGYLPQVWLAPEEIRQLRNLVRYRQQQVNQRRAVKQRIGALLRNHRVKPSERNVHAWSCAWWRWLGEAEGLGDQGRWVMNRHIEDLARLGRRIVQVERRLKRLTAKDVVVRALLKHKGIGPVTAWVLRAEIGQFDRFANGKQLGRFCGLSPRNVSSGERQADGGLVKAGNKLLRSTLIEAAHRLKRYDPRWSQLAQKMSASGKHGSVIAAAIANRWMRSLYHKLQPQVLMAEAA